MTKQVKQAKKVRGRPKAKPIGGTAGSEFGSRAADLRRKAAIGVEELAKLSAVSMTTIYDIEAGRLASPPNLTTVQRLDKALNAGGKLVGFFTRLLATLTAKPWAKASK